MEDNPQTENIVEQVQNEPVKKKSQFLLPLILFFVFILFSVLLYLLLTREGNPLQYLLKPQTTESQKETSKTEEKEEATESSLPTLEYIENTYVKETTISASEEYMDHVNTNLPVATIKSLVGKIVYRYKDLFLVSDLNGDNAMKLVDKGIDRPLEDFYMTDIGFAGYSNDKNIFYYSKLVGTKSIVYKKNLLIGTEKELFSFESNYTKLDAYMRSVNIRKDEKYAVYSSNNMDLVLRNLENNTETTSLVHEDCSKKNQSYLPWIKSVYGAAACGSGYFNPIWSPNGAKIMVDNYLWEGYILRIVDPFSNPIADNLVQHGGGRHYWSNDSSSIVSPGDNYGTFGLYLMADLKNPTSKDLMANRTDYIINAVHSTVFSPDGKKIAFTYYSYSDHTGHTGIAIYDIQTDTITPIISIPSRFYELVKWLSDGKTVIFGNRESNYYSINLETKSQKRIPIWAQEIVEVIE